MIIFHFFFIITFGLVTFDYALAGTSLSSPPSFYRVMNTCMLEGNKTDNKTHTYIAFEASYDKGDPSFSVTLRAAPTGTSQEGNSLPPSSFPDTITLILEGHGYTLNQSYTAPGDESLTQKKATYKLDGDMTLTLLDDMGRASSLMLNIDDKTISLDLTSFKRPHLELKSSCWGDRVYGSGASSSSILGPIDLAHPLEEEPAVKAPDPVDIRNLYINAADFFKTAPTQTTGTQTDTGTVTTQDVVV